MDYNAIVDGDFAVMEDELQPVLKSLVKEKINIVAIHQHMTHEDRGSSSSTIGDEVQPKILANAIKGRLLVGGLFKVSSPLQN
jgi:vacuolar-type H+-ATPase subunit F/Vma7